MLFWRQWLLVVSILVHELELFILTRLVDIFDMLLSLFHDFLPDVLHVSILRALFDLNSYLWVFDKDVIIQELLRD